MVLLSGLPVEILQLQLQLQSSMEFKHVPVTLDNDRIHCTEWYGMLIYSRKEVIGYQKSQMLFLANGMQEATMNRGKRL